LIRARAAQSGELRQALSTVVIGSALVGCGARSLDAGLGPDLTNVGSCPLRTADEWQGFLARTATRPEWIETCDDVPCAPDYDRIQAEVAPVLAQCAAFLADNPPLEACTDRTRRFVGSWLDQHAPDTYGFTSPDPAYFAAGASPDAPAAMTTPPASLLAAMPLLSDVEEVARQNGWPYVVQRSCLGGVRLFVLTADPSGRFDQWTLMNLRTETAPTEVHALVSFLAVQKADAAGTPLPAVRVHFRDYVVAPFGASFQLTSDPRDNAKCYSCHPSGARTLIGIRTPELQAEPVLGEPTAAPPDFSYQRLRALNERLVGYGLCDWNGDIAVADHGPALGGAEGCSACHDGRQRGPITVSTSRRQLRHRVVDQLAMPPAPGLPELVEREAMSDPPLTQAEQEQLDGALQAHTALLDGLEAPSAPLLEAWLLATSCGP
jgi:hypothetical protein